MKHHQIHPIFLSYYPLKQGLKPPIVGLISRVAPEFLSYYPLKQGLKLKELVNQGLVTQWIFILLSIKTRIETIICCRQMSTINHFYPTIH